MKLQVERPVAFFMRIPYNKGIGSWDIGGIMKPLNTFVVISLFASLFISSQGMAYQPDDSAQSMEQNYAKCLKIKDDAARMQCFDSLNKKQKSDQPLTTQPVEKRAIPTPKPASPAMPKTHSTTQPTSGFGAEHLQSTAPVEEQDEITLQLVAVKREVGQLNRWNEFVFSDGQVWQQTNTSQTRAVRPEEGINEKITIKRRMLGSYSLYYKGRNFKVKRIK